MMVDSLAVLAHVLVRAGDVSMGITIFPIGWIFLCYSRNQEMIKLQQRSINVQLMDEKLRSLNHMKLRIDT